MRFYIRILEIPKKKEENLAVFLLADDKENAYNFEFIMWNTVAEKCTQSVNFKIT